MSLAEKIDVIPVYKLQMHAYEQIFSSFEEPKKVDFLAP